MNRFLHHAALATIPALVIASPLAAAQKNGAVAQDFKLTRSGESDEISVNRFEHCASRKLVIDKIPLGRLVFLANKGAGSVWITTRKNAFQL